MVDGDLYVWSDTENKWVNVGKVQGPKGDKGDKGDSGPESIRAAYLVTFNNGTTYDGLAVNTNERLPIDRKELDSSNLVTLDSNEETIKFNEIGYYKISFIVSSRVLETDPGFNPKNDFISIGFRLTNTDNIYVGGSKWVYNDEYITISSQGIISVENTDNIYELVNVGNQTIFLNTPDLNDIESNSYFTNALVNIVIEYLGK